MDNNPIVSGYQNEVIGKLTSFGDVHIGDGFSNREKHEYILSQINKLQWKMILYKSFSSVFVLLILMNLLLKY